jgi:hypothetical protein
MKKRILWGMLALALISIMGLTGCPSVDQQVLKGVPQNLRADLYWVGADQRLETIDGKKQGTFPTLYGLLGAPAGGGEKNPKGLSEPPIKWNDKYAGPPVQVSAGEHTIVMSDKMLVGRKNYTGTFNFEAGKKYIAQLTTPTLYESMQKPGFDALKDIGKDLAGHMKDSLAGNQLIIIAETKKDVPTFPDYSIKGTDWKKSIK